MIWCTPHWCALSSVASEWWAFRKDTCLPYVGARNGLNRIIDIGTCEWQGRSPPSFIWCMYWKSTWYTRMVMKVVCTYRDVGSLAICSVLSSWRLPSDCDNLPPFKLIHVLIACFIVTSALSFYTTRINEYLIQQHLQSFIYPHVSPIRRKIN